jgi:predicted dehydrogenase
MKTIRWGMIGCGDVAEVKSGPGLYKADRSTLVAVMRRNGALAADFARRHGVARWHDDAEAIIGAPDIDAVYIATLTDTHRDYTVRCAAAGKAVYVEKPMAMSHGQCREMIDACRKAGVPLWVAYYRRALPRCLAVRDLIAEGAIGPVRMVITRQFQRLPSRESIAAGLPWRIDPALSGGGFFFEAVCHTFDLLDFLFGAVEEVRGFAANQAGAYPPEDIVSASYRFASGVHGSGAWCFSADVDDEYNEIVGAHGRIRFSTFAPSPIVLTRGSVTREVAVADPPHVQQPLIQSIVDEMNGHGRCPSTGASAARTAWVLDCLLNEFRIASASATGAASRAGTGAAPQEATAGPPQPVPRAAPGKAPTLTIARRASRRDSDA